MTGQHGRPVHLANPLHHCIEPAHDLWITSRIVRVLRYADDQPYWVGSGLLILIGLVLPKGTSASVSAGCHLFVEKEVYVAGTRTTKAAALRAGGTTTREMHSLAWWPRISPMSGFR